MSIKEIVVSFDTTGSMYPCLTQVRRNVDKLITQLFAIVPNLRMGVIAHGDYCDHDKLIAVHDLSTNQKSLCDFIRSVPSTNGGDAPEAYEVVLKRAKALDWTVGSERAMVMIGDEVPHTASDPQNKNHIDWWAETHDLAGMGVMIYAVQCLGNRHATQFYKSLATDTKGCHLNLSQFSDIEALLIAIGHRQAGGGSLATFESEHAKKTTTTRSIDRMFAALSGRAVSTTMTPSDLTAVPEGRFQVLTVGASDIPIAIFCKEQGIEFSPGRGFYELTKSVKVQGTKEIVLMERTTGDMFTGTRARELIGLPLDDSDVRLKPVNLERYVPFIQSTSLNRKLLARTRFLYEVTER